MNQRYQTEQPTVLIGRAFEQAVEARKRCGYIRDALRRGDTFTAGEDLKLTIAALDDATRDLSHLVGEPAPPPEDESDEGPWLDANGAFGLDLPQNHPDDCDCDDCGYENHGAHLQLFAHPTATSRIFDEQ